MQRGLILFFLFQVLPDGTKIRYVTVSIVKHYYDEHGTLVYTEHDALSPNSTQSLSGYLGDQSSSGTSSGTSHNSQGEARYQPLSVASEPVSAPYIPTTI